MDTGLHRRLRNPGTLHLDEFRHSLSITSTDCPLDHGRDTIRLLCGENSSQPDCEGESSLKRAKHGAEFSSE